MHSVLQKTRQSRLRLSNRIRRRHFDIYNRIQPGQALNTRTLLNQKQRGTLEKMAQFFQIFRAERAIDDAVIAAHPDRHALADNDLIGIIDHRFF